MVKANELDAAEKQTYDTTTYKVYITNIDSTHNCLSDVVSQFTENAKNLGNIYVIFSTIYIL